MKFFRVLSLTLSLISLSSVYLNGQCNANIATPNGTEIGCTNNVTLDANSSTPGNVTFCWGATAGGTFSEAKTDGVITPLTTGTYTVTVSSTAGGGCTDEASVIVTQYLVAPIVTITTSGTITCTNTSVTVDASNSTGSGTLTYSWSSGGTGSMETVTAGGMYTVTVTDSVNGCTNSGTVTISEDTTLPTVSVATPGSISCTNASVTLDASGSSGSGTLTYDWSSGGTGSTEMVTAGGMYTVTVTDSANGCTNTETVTVSEDTSPPTVTIATPSSITCVNSSVTLDASGSNGNGTLTYNWSSGGTTSMESVTAAGMFTVTVTDSGNGCTNTETVTVSTDTTPPTVTITTPITITCINPSVTLDASGSSGGGSLTYSWSSGGTSSMETVTAGGMYTVTVTDSGNGCTDTETVTVSSNTAVPAVTISPANPLINCSIQTANLLASATGVSYSWSSGGTTSTEMVSAGGTYTVTVTDSGNGCTNTDSVTVSSDTSSPSVSIATPSTITCSITSATLDASGSTGGGSLTYSWSSGGTSSMEIVSAGGMYTVTVTDLGNGCTETETVTVSEDTSPPTVNIGTPNNLTCINTSVTLNASGSSGSGSLNYNWSSGGTSSMETVTSGGMYTVTITDSGNGCTNTGSVTVSSDTTTPTANCSATDNTNCATPNGTVAVLTNASSPLYSWEDSSGAPISSNSSVSGLGPDTYFVTVTDGNNGCTEECQVTVNSNTINPTASCTGTDNTNCASPNGTASVSTDASSPFYNWENSSGNLISTNSMATGLGSGTYFVTVTDGSSGCTNDCQVTIQNTTSNPVASIADPMDVLDCNTFSLNLSGTSSTGTGLSYSWSGPSGGINGSTSGSSVSVDEAGTYGLTVTDGNSCTDAASIDIDEFIILPTVNIATPAQITCTNNSVTVSAGGSTAGNPGATLSYNWSTGGTANSINVSTGGSYAVTVSDQYGCSNAGSVVVGQNTTPPTVSVTANPVTVCAGQSSVLTANATNVSFGWSNNATGQAISTPALTTTAAYTVTVTSTANGCTSSASATINVIPAPTAMATVNDSEICTGESITLSQTNPGLTCVWAAPTPMAGCSISITPTANSTYIVTVTDVNNCSDTDQVSVTVRPRPNAQISAAEMSGTVNNDAVICAGESTTLTALDTAPGSTPQGYSWSNGTTTNVTTVSPGVPGVNYVVTVTNTFGCSNSSARFVTVNPLPNPSLTIIENSGIAANDGLICEGYTGGIIQGNAGTSTNPVSYIWNDGGMPGFSTTGQYEISNNTPAAISSYNVNLQVTDGNNCSDVSATLPVTVCRAPELDFTLGGVLFVFTERDIQFEGIVTQPGFCGGADCSVTNWQWDFGDGLTGSGQIPPVVVYSTEGNKNITITASTSCGCSFDYQRSIFVRSIDDCQAIITIDGQEESIVEECLNSNRVFTIANESKGKKLAGGELADIIEMDWFLTRFEYDNNGVEVVLENTQITANGDTPNFVISSLVTNTPADDVLEESFSIKFDNPGNYRLTHRITDNTDCTKSEPTVLFFIKETPTATFSKNEIEVCFGQSLLISIDDPTAVNPDLEIKITPTDDPTVQLIINGDIYSVGESFFLPGITEDSFIQISSVGYSGDVACMNIINEILEVTVVEPIELSESQFICDDESMFIESLTLSFEGARDESDDEFCISSLFLQSNPAERFNFDNICVAEGVPLEFDNFIDLITGVQFSDWQMLPDTNYVLVINDDSDPSMCNTDREIVLNLFCDCQTEFGQIVDVGADIDQCTNAPIIIDYDRTLETLSGNATRNLVISTADLIESNTDILISYPIGDDLQVEINASDLPYQTETQYNAFIYLGETVDSFPSFSNQCDVTSEFFRSFTFHQAPLSNGLILFAGRDSFCNNSFDIPIGLANKLSLSFVDISYILDGETTPFVTNYQDSLYNADINLAGSDTITILVEESKSYSISGGTLSCSDSYSEELFIREDSAPDQYPVILWQGDNDSPEIDGTRGHILALELYDPVTDQLKNPAEGPDDLCFQWGKTILPFDILPIQEIYIVNSDAPVLQTNNESTNGQFLFAGNDQQLNQIIETPQVEDDLSYFWVDTWRKSDDPTCSAKAIDPDGTTGRTDITGQNLPYDAYFFCTTRNYLNVDGPPIFGFRNGEVDDNYLSIFPNPNNGSFSLEIVGDWIGDYYYNITDMTGKLLTQKSFNKDTRTKTIEISQNGLTPGMYIVKVSNSFGAIQTRKVIVY